MTDPINLTEIAALRQYLANLPRNADNKTPIDLLTALIDAQDTTKLTRQELIIELYKVRDAIAHCQDNHHADTCRDKHHCHRLDDAKARLDTILLLYV